MLKILGLGIIIIFIILLMQKSSPNINYIVIPRTPNIIPVDDPVIIPTTQLDFYDVKILSNRIKENSKYADIINRSRNPVLQHDRDTNAHETTHMIQADLRNIKNKEVNYTQRFNSFYLIGGKGIDFPEPRMRKREVIAYVPTVLREYRFPTYVSGQTAWDDTPLYLVDEWCAYMNGAETAIEDYKNNKHDGTKYDAVKGVMEFSVYCTALCMAIKDKDPEYWENNIKFKEFIKQQLIRSHSIFNEGMKIDLFQGYKQDQYIDRLNNDPSCESLRKFLREEFGGVWVSTQ